MLSIVQSAITILIFVFMLGALVVIHEFGHFLTARLAGVRVLEFGIGFPPRARVLRSKGDTLFTLNWLPIGGFVRLEGEDGDSDDPRSFVRASLPVKLIVLVAGVAMNIALAFAIFFTIAWLANPTVALVVKGIQADSPAHAAGVVVGDSITSLDGQPFDYFGGTGGSPSAILRDHAGQTVQLGIVQPDGLHTTVTALLRAPGEINAGNGALGITFAGALTGGYVQRAPAEAAGIAGARTVQALSLVLDGLGQLASSIVQHPTQAPPVTGPIGIASQVGDVFWQLGPIFTLYLAGILSANLALVNILPFPPLDGGRVAVLLLKRLSGERLSERVERLTYLAGFAFLMTFLVWVTFFDITAPGRGQ
jgi:regulator of sigma E protease